MPNLLRSFSLTGLCLALLLALAACGDNPTPTNVAATPSPATVIESPTAGAAASPTPAEAPSPTTAAAPTDTPAPQPTPRPPTADDLALAAAAVLEQMRAHVTVAGELQAAGQGTDAATHMDTAIKQWEFVAGPLGDAASKAVRGALDTYAAALSGSSAKQAQTDLLKALDTGLAAVIGSTRATDRAFQARLIHKLLEKMEGTYSESFQDGKIVKATSYQTAYAILKIMSQRFTALQESNPEGFAKPLAAGKTALRMLGTIMPTLAPPATPGSPAEVGAQVSALATALKAFTGEDATATPAAAAAPPSSAVVFRDTRANIQAAIALYKDGKADVAYEKAAAAYLEGFEKLEADLLKVNKDVVPAVEADFKALRDGIKAGTPVADLETIAQRLTEGLDQAEKLLNP